MNDLTEKTESVSTEAQPKPTERIVRARLDNQTPILSLRGFVEPGKDYHVRRRGRTITITPINVNTGFTGGKHDRDP